MKATLRTICDRSFCQKRLPDRGRLCGEGGGRAAFPEKRGLAEGCAVPGPAARGGVHCKVLSSPPRHWQDHLNPASRQFPKMETGQGRAGIPSLGRPPKATRSMSSVWRAEGSLSRASRLPKPSART